MNDGWQLATANQFDAALATLVTCTEACPTARWDDPIGELTFSRIAFHALFFADYYLEQDICAFKKQAFHEKNIGCFAEYEELEFTLPTAHHSKEWVLKYARFCRDKSARVVISENADVCASPCGFPGKQFSRAELHLYNIRHIQHHVGQLSMHLRARANVAIPWVSTVSVCR
jgi:hypothetical protein